MDEGMVSLKFQKRLAASILQCGRGKVWLANGVNKISMTDFRQNTRKAGQGRVHHQEAFQDSLKVSCSLDEGGQTKGASTAPNPPSTANFYRARVS